MSVVAAKIMDNKIIMASDSIIIGGFSRTDQERFKSTKMSKVNGMLVGSCGYLQEGAMFQVFCGNRKPAGTKIKDVVEFMIDFKKWVKELSLNSDDDTKKMLSNQYIIAFDSTLWVINGIDVIPVKDYYAIGAGEDYALAAMHLGCTPREAVKVACDMSCYVSDPILEETIELV